MRVAIIPARGGSKRIPRKNIRLFHGRPVIGYSIDAAAASGLFDRIVVSTDDAEIAEISRSLGAETPFVRPPELADDHAGTTPVVAHAIGMLRAAGDDVRHACCIYATAPLLDARFLSEGFDRLVDGGFDYVFSATSFPFPIQRAIRLLDGGRIEPFDPQSIGRRSQDLEHAYHDAGQFYWGTADAWAQQRLIFGRSSAALVLPRHLVQDIDTIEDWHRAELMYKAVYPASGDVGAE